MSFPERPKSLLTLVGQATFTGFRSAPGEIQLKMTGKHAIIIHQVSRKRFRAHWAGGRPLISMTRQAIDGNLYTVKRQVAESRQKPEGLMSMVPPELRQATPPRDPRHPKGPKPAASGRGFASFSESKLHRVTRKGGRANRKHNPAAIVLPGTRYT